MVLLNGIGVIVLVSESAAVSLWLADLLRMDRIGVFVWVSASVLVSIWFGERLKWVE